VLANADSWKRKGVVLGVCLLVTVFDFVLFRTPGWIYGYDDIHYFIYLPSVVVDRDLDFDNQIEAFRRQRQDDILDHVLRNANGAIVNNYGIGHALLSLPFFLLGFPLTFLARLFGLPWGYDGMNSLFQFSTTAASVVWGLVGLGLCQRLLERHFGELVSRRAVSIVFWATPLIYYMCLTPAMAHASAFFAVALWLYIWDQRKPNLPLWQAVALGAAGALPFLVRYPNSLVWLGVSVDWFRWRAERPPESGCGRWLLFWSVAGLTFLLCIAPQLWVWRQMFGTVWVNPYQSDDLFSHWTHPQVWRLLFSDLRGLFNWHPVLLIAFVGLWFSLRSKRWLAAHCLVVVSGLVLLYASYSPSLGVSFGSRVFVEALPFFAVGLAAFLSSGRGAALRWGLCVGLIPLNLSFALAYRLESGSYEEAFTGKERIIHVTYVPARVLRRVREIIPKLGFGSERDNHNLENRSGNRSSFDASSQN